MLLSWKTCLGAYTLHGGGRECVPLTPPPDPQPQCGSICVIAGTRWFLCPSVAMVGGKQQQRHFRMTPASQTLCC